MIWAIRYLEINTRSWWSGGKKVLLATESMREVSWAERTLKAEAARDTVKKAPEDDESAPVTEEYERSLEHHYGLSQPAGASR